MSVTPDAGFYRDQLLRSFAHTNSFAATTGRAVQEIFAGEAFAAVLRESKPGSLECARRLGEMALVHLDRPGTAPGPWWHDLCNYERAWFLQAATTDPGPATNRPRRGTSALCATFHWDIPKLLERLAADQAITDELQRNLVLLFSRGADGKVYVAEVGPPVEKVFRATNGLRTVEQIAAAAGVAPEETNAILTALAGVGAIVAAKSPEEILAALKLQS